MNRHSYEEIILDNGAKGLLIDVHNAQVMYFMLNFRAGDFLSPKNKWETAHVLEHMMIGANKAYPRAQDYQAQLQKNGAFFNAYTSSYDISYVSECADFEWNRIFSLMLNAIEGPLLKEDEFKTEMGNVREELSSDLNEHYRQLIIASRRAHGMVANPDGERLTQLKNITVEDIKKHYERTHTSHNLRFVIAGNMTGRKEAIIRRLNKLTLPRGRRFSMPNEKPKSLDGVLYIERSGVDNLQFAINLLASEHLQQPEDDSLAMLNTMLTSTIHSGILGEAREKGLAYHIASAQTHGKDMTNWWFGAQVMPDNAGPVFDIITKHLKKVMNGKIKQEDVDAAKQYSIGRLKRSVQTVGSLARNYSGGYFYDGRIEDFYEVEPRIKAVSKESMIDIANRMAQEKIWGVSVLSSQNEKLATELSDKIAVLWQ